MHSKSRVSSSKSGGTILRVSQPRGRDPFCNTPLISAGRDASGLELFWISSWNDHSGCTGVLVNEWGKERVYRFGKQYPGFYSAVHEKNDVLWMCGFLHKVVRLQLNTKKLQSYPSGAKGALAFSGMAFDRPTGKLFAAAHPPPKVEAFSFDTRKRKKVKIYHDFSSDGLYMRFSFANGDGTYTIVMTTPGLVFVRWDPARETVQARTIMKTLDAHREGSCFYKLVQDEKGKYYVPFHGWYDPRKGTFDSSGPRPPKEMTWFARRDKLVYGACPSGATNCEINEWNLQDGSLRPVASFPDANPLMVNMTSGGDLVCVNLYGYFYRINPADGSTVCARRLATDSYGPMQCILRLDREHLLGTNFITQRFWEVNLKTGQGRDCGRAAPGGGQINLVWKIKDRAYMAAYTGGQLMEYDWKEPARFPENPRVVTVAPHGMRPVAGATGGRFIYYACNAPYGKLGGTLTKYDTLTGRSWHRHDIIPGLAITSLWLDRSGKTILCGTTIHGDQRSCPPLHDASVIARISADDLSVQDKVKLPPGAEHSAVLGLLSAKSWLFAISGKIVPEKFKNLPYCLALNGERLKAPKAEDLFRLPGDFKKWPDRVEAYAGRPGFFLCRVNGAVELWDLAKAKRIAVLWKKDPAVNRVFLQDNSLYLTRGREIIVMENALRMAV
jgi:hypothetical protein